MKRLARGAIGTVAGTLAYTVPNGFQTEVIDINLANTTAGALTCALHFVPSGGSAAASNMLFPTVSIAANTLIQWTGSEVLSAGDFIQAIGSGAGITMNISGEETRG
jgi:hypothetical protein